MPKWRVDMLKKELAKYYDTLNVSSLEDIDGLIESIQLEEKPTEDSKALLQQLLTIKERIQALENAITKQESMPD